MKSHDAINCNNINRQLQLCCHPVIAIILYTNDLDKPDAHQLQALVVTPRNIPRSGCHLSAPLAKPITNIAR